ncbi:MAG TPA: TetR family transcriptional regulator [Desulfomicrobium sp.]|nr:TetR family transcriptional regulator [Desulfomicrobium sp.]
MTQVPKYLSAEERRAMTVKTVLELAAVRNPADITTMAIAAHMGLSQAAVFRHFATKDEVWQAVMDWVSVELLSRVQAAADGAAGPLAALEAVFAAHVGFAAEYPGVPRTLFAELQRTEPTPAKKALEELLNRYGEILAALLEQGKREGEVDEGVDVPVAVAMFIGSIQGLVIKSFLEGDMGHASKTAARTFGLYRRAVGRLP